MGHQLNSEANLGESKERNARLKHLLEDFADPRLDLRPSDNFSAYGQELNGTTWALCRMNMFLHGLDTARIERGDTIRKPRSPSNA